MRYSFASDNRAGACPEVVAAIVDEASRAGGGYGEDETSAALAAAFDDVFERQVRAYPVSTGTAANSLALACCCPPWGAVLCSGLAHVYVDESGGPEFYGHGLRVAAIGDDGHGRIDPAALTATVEGGESHGVHSTLPSVLSATQATEAGTTYSVEHLEELAAIAHRSGMKVHLDGARIANAVVSSGATPAELTWRAGVDVAVWGGSKNGAIAAEAVVFFDEELAETFERRRKRGGHLHSKLRFTSAQLLALLRDDVWLTNARQANAAATQIATAATAAGIGVAHPVDANMVFLDARTVDVESLRADGWELYVERHHGADLVRVVTSWDTAETEVAALVSQLAG